MVVTIISNIAISAVYKLSDEFYIDYSHNSYPEILEKKDRPYSVALFEYTNDYYIAVPFRTHMNHNNGYHFYSVPENKKNSGVDYSKMLIINKDRYIGNQSIVRNDEMRIYN